MVWSGPLSNPMLREKAAKIKLLILDVDGVMTDGTLWMDDQGQEQKRFNIKDGFGLRCLMNNGIDVAIITGRKSGAVAHRAGELGIREVYQKVTDKRVPFYEILSRKGLTAQQVCYIGDDLPDLPLLEKVGLSITVADAVDEVKNRVDFVTDHQGGHGALREICELILKARDKWEGVVSSFVKPG
jgi:3-deoxy-D-manno-octulosonate 8-phosphate phosphatase (KDO 8-P phosphatase)